MTDAEFKKKLVEAVSRDLASIRRQLFGPSKRSISKARRAKQPWLKRLRAGG